MRGMQKLRKSVFLQLVNGMAAGMMALGPMCWGGNLPTGGAVQSGNATIAIDGTAMNINQSSQKVFINFDSYSIGAGYSVNYAQPGATAVAVNKVIGADPSQIFGALNANGIVYLLNPNGVLFGTSATVNVAGIVAGAYSDCREDANGQFILEGAGGDVSNQGTITASNFAALAGKNVNNSGELSAPQIDLLAGRAVSIGSIAGGNFTLSFDNAGDVINAGKINASGIAGGAITIEGTPRRPARRCPCRRQRR